MPVNTSYTRMMKTTKRGKPFLKDTLDLFAALIVSLQLGPHKQFFRTFPNSFSPDEVAQTLKSLNVIQHKRGLAREPTRVVTTTITTNFSLSREITAVMSQHFMDACLIKSAADPSSFKDRGTYILTPKGLHVLERFISKNEINADHLRDIFITQPICIELFHLERRSDDDEIIVTQSIIIVLFRHFVGRQPNYPSQRSLPQDVFQRYKERVKGISLVDVPDRATQPLRLANHHQYHKYWFAAVSALEWLCDFTSLFGREEAAEMAAQFVRFGLITLVSDKRKKNDTGIIFTVRGGSPGGNSPVSQHGEFHCTHTAIYKITDEGQRVVNWDNTRGGTQNSPNVLSGDLSDDCYSADKTAEENLNSNYKATEKKKNTKESNTERLWYILEDPSLRLLFRELLRNHFCEENLSFWLDVQEFKRKFNRTSTSVVAVSPPSQPGNRTTPGQAAMDDLGLSAKEHHHESLINTAFVIYYTYLAPSSQFELNIDHGLRNELVEYLEDVVTNRITWMSLLGRPEPEQTSNFNATQLQTVIQLYERVQTHVFRLMATNSVPKFISTTPDFLAIRRNRAEDFNPMNDLTRLLTFTPSQTPGLNTGEAGPSTTISQHASEWEHHWQQAQCATPSLS